MKRLKKRTAAVLAAVMLAAAMPASSLMAQTASDETDTITVETAAAETESGAVLPESLATQTESETAQPAYIAVLAETDQGTLTADGIQQSVPTAYIEQQIADPSVSMIRIKLLDNGSQVLSRDLLVELDIAYKILYVEMYESMDASEPYFTWMFMAASVWNIVMSICMLRSRYRCM